MSYYPNYCTTYAEIITALANFGCAHLAPRSILLDASITLQGGQSIIGCGSEASVLVAAAGTDPVVISGATSGPRYVRGVTLVRYNSDVGNAGDGLDQTAGDFVLEDVSAEGCTIGYDLNGGSFVGRFIRSSGTSTTGVDVAAAMGNVTLVSPELTNTTPTTVNGSYAGVLSSGVGTGGIDTVTSGAISVDTRTTHLSVTGTQAYSLAAGRYDGQRKRVECTVAATTPVGTLTLADAFGSESTTWVFSAVGQMVEFEWTLTGWKVIEVRTAGTDAPAAASTLRPLIRYHVISITGTQDWVLGAGAVPGQTKTIVVSAAASVPVGTISGLFYDDSDGSADGVDINMDAAADQATVVWDGARWFPTQLVSATIS